MSLAKKYPPTMPILEMKKLTIVVMEGVTQKTIPKTSTANILTQLVAIRSPQSTLLFTVSSNSKRTKTSLTIPNLVRGTICRGDRSTLEEIRSPYETTVIPVSKHQAGGDHHESWADTRLLSPFKLACTRKPIHFGVLYLRLLAGTVFVVWKISPTLGCRRRRAHVGSNKLNNQGYFIATDPP
jgi:hypothetical protein